MSPPALGIRPREVALLVVVAFVWGFNFVVIKVGLDDFPPLLFSALRFLISAVPAVFFVPRPKVSWAWILAIGLVFGVLLFGFLFLGIYAGMPPGLASLVMQMHVFFTILLGVVLLGERPPLVRWLAVAFGFAGIGLIAASGGGAGNGARWTVPLLLVLAGALSWGAHNIMMKKMPATDMLGLMVWVSLIPPVPLILLSIAADGWPRVISSVAHLSWSGLAAVAYTGFISTVFAYGVWGAMLQRHSAGTVAPFALLIPVFGLGSAAIFLGESFGPLRIVAAVIILAALALNVLAPSLAARAARVRYQRA
ncbi:MAG TPA: EamA family transporter [Stellaceae bacterium]|jgi:O-acetylserine/cysteine efflux transporter